MEGQQTPQKGDYIEFCYSYAQRGIGVVTETGKTGFGRYYHIVYRNPSFNQPSSVGGEPEYMKAQLFTEDNFRVLTKEEVTLLLLER